MNKITLIGIDTAKQVFHLVGVDARGHYIWRKQVRRARLLSTLAQLECCEVVLEACGASHHWARNIKALARLSQLSTRKKPNPLNSLTSGPQGLHYKRPVISSNLRSTESSAAAVAAVPS